MAKFKRSKSNGFARTKRYPFENHPAYFEKQGNSSDDVKFVTFTHSNKVTLKNGDILETIQLSKNIDENVRYELDEKKREKTDRDDSYMVKRTYVGKRSSLGSTIRNYSIHSDDKEKVSNQLNDSKIYTVNFSKNKTKKGKENKKKKCRSSTRRELVWRNSSQLRRVITSIK